MPSTYEPIYTTTLSSNQSTVSFNSFGGYTDLKIVCNIKITAGGLIFKPNSNGSSIYSGTYLYSAGASASSSRLTTGDLGGTGLYLINGSVSNANFIPVILDFMNYTNTTTHKTVLARFSNTDTYVGASVVLAQTTNAITTLDFSCDGGGSIANGSSFTLYGIKAA
jgi:hypothetical protein